MPLNIESVDDPVITDETPLFSAGQISNSRPANLPPNAAWLLQNCEISTTGKVASRRGTDLIGANANRSNPILALGFFKTASISNLISIASDGTVGRLKYWNGTNWQSPASPFDYGPSDPVSMAQGIDSLWMAQSAIAPTYWDGTNNISISGFTDAPLHPDFVEWHTNRVVWAGMTASPYTLAFSEYLDGTVYDANNWNVDIGSGDGDSITGIRSWTNSLLAVFKTHSIWTINCDPLLVAQDPNGNVSAFPINQVHKQIGCLANATAVQVGADIFFLSDSGVRSLIRTQASDSRSEIGPALSDPVDDIIKRINMAKVGLSSAIYWQDKYMISLPLDSAAYPNYVLVFDTRTQSWTGYWTNWTPTAFARWIEGDTPKLVIGHSDGAVTNYLDYIDESDETTATYEDQGETYTTAIETRAFAMGDQDSPKTGLFVRLEFIKSQGDVTVSGITGRNETPQEIETFSTLNEGVTFPITLPVTFPSGGTLRRSLDLMALGQWREIRIRIESDAHKIALNKVSVGAFIDAYIVQE